MKKKIVVANAIVKQRKRKPGGNRMDINREIRIAVNTGQTLFGVKEVKRSVADSSAKLIIVASNCPETALLKTNKFEDVKVYQFKGNGHDLGSAAGKPFSISAMSIIKAGESNILALKEG